MATERRLPAPITLVIETDEEWGCLGAALEMHSRGLAAATAYLAKNSDATLDDLDVSALHVAVMERLQAKMLDALIATRADATEHGVEWVPGEEV